MDLNKMLYITCGFLPTSIAKIVHMSEIWKFPNVFQRVTHIFTLQVATFCPQPMLTWNIISSKDKLKAFEPSTIHPIIFAASAFFTQ